MFYKLSKALKKKDGFTLVELMVVVIIIGILVAIAIPVYNGVQTNTRETACFANQRTIEGAASMFYSEAGEWPTVQELVDGKEVNGNTIGPFLSETPVCPDEGTYKLNPVIDEDSTTEYGKAVCDAHAYYRD